VEILEPRDCPSTVTLCTLLGELTTAKPIQDAINIAVATRNANALRGDLLALSQHSTTFLSDLASATGLASFTNPRRTATLISTVVAECLQTFRDAEKRLSHNVAADLQTFDSEFQSLLAPLQSPGPAGQPLRRDITTYLQAFSIRVWMLDFGQLSTANTILALQENALEAVVKDLVP
jgi:hypothetical protein